jgi:uncharacterized membrane protein
MSDQNPPPGDDPIFGEQPANDPVLGGPSTPPPPPPPPAGPPAPPAGPGAGDTVSSAFTWAIQRFQQHLVVWISLAAAVFVLYAIQAIVGRVLSSNTPSTTTGLFANIGVSLVLAVVFGALAWLASVGVYRAALRRTQGVTPSFDMLTTGENLGPYIVVALVYGIAVFVGLVLCFLPGIVVIFLFMFAPLFALDKGQGVGEAFGNSYRLVTGNIGAVVLAALVNIVASFLGGILFGLLSLVTLPFSALFTAYVYRTLQNEEVSA